MFECLRVWFKKPRVYQMVAIPNVLVADEAEKVICDAAVGCGKMDLFRVRAHCSDG